MNERVAANATDPDIGVIAQDIVTSTSINDCTSDQLSTLTTEQMTLDDNKAKVVQDISTVQAAIEALTGSTVAPVTDAPPTAGVPATTTGQTARRRRGRI